MTLPTLLLSLALTAAAQPKLLLNAQVDTRSASAGLDAVFRGLLSAQPQPAWIAYEVPSVRSYSLGCEYVSPAGPAAPGVVHLEPPDHALVLFRVEKGAVERIRALSPDCEIDAGGVPFHWLTEVRPAESIALLGTFDRPQAVMAMAMHADAAALDRLIDIARKDGDQRVRRAAVNAIARSRDPRAQAFLEDVLKH